MGYNRILLVDDNESIHEDIEAILSTSFNRNDDLQDIENDLFGGSPEHDTDVAQYVEYDIDHAYQGKEALGMVDQAHQNENPYALVFMDVRMPPGMDGIQTIQQIWEKYPYTEMVICTAYSDYSWDEIIQNLGNTDKLLFIKKPFDATALKQMALTLTTKWQLQQESISYTEKLEKEVDERTEQLNELVEKYKDMKDRAEKASATKSKFLANMSHEIRTPMNGVIGMNDLLLNTRLNEEQRELSEMVKQSAKSLLRVIDDILDFSKIEAGEMKLEYTPFSLRDIIKQTLQIIKYSSKEKDLSIKYSIDDGIPEALLGDPTRIRQILLNYGSNAIKFTEEGSVTFSAELMETEGDKHRIRLSVKDTGIGIPQNKQNNIFNSFSQADSSTTRKYGGTGLGLAICRQLAELMNGEVGLESEEGVGSTFYSTIPLKEAKESGLESDNTVGQSNTLNIPQNKHRVLVAEDNKINQMVAEKMLEREGFIVDIVETGTAAIEAVKQKEYALVLMDIQMPEMDGYEATKAIRKMEGGQSKHIPIIALTASALEQDRRLCLEAGMDDYIAKPIDMDTLIKVLKGAVQRESSIELT